MWVSWSEIDFRSIALRKIPITIKERVMQKIYVFGICVALFILSGFTTRILHSEETPIRPIVAEAEKFRLGIHRGVPVLSWTTNESVRTAMNCDGPTKRKLDDLWREFVKEHTEIESGEKRIHNLPKEEQQQAKDELGLRIRAIESRTSEALYSLLSEKQVERFHGTFLQHSGAEALL